MWAVSWLRNEGEDANTDCENGGLKPYEVIDG